MHAGKWRWLAAVGVGLACGDLATEPDGGTDSAAPDVATIDASIVDTGLDATVDAKADVVDASKDSGKKPVDAPYVDFDAATAPWAVTFGVGAILGVAVDSQQHILVGGEAAGNGSSFVLEELDQAGAKKWDVASTATSNLVNNRAWAVAFDSSGNALAAGYTGAALDIGGGSKGPGAFIAKFDSKGVFQWEYGPFASTTFRKVRTKSNGNVVAFGYLNGSDDYGGGKLSSGSYHAAVLLEVTSSGSYVNAHAWTGGDQLGFALAVDPWDDVFVSGTFQGTIDFGGGAMTGPQVGLSGPYNIFIAEFDSTGAYVNQMQAKSSATTDAITELATDWQGNLLVSGLAYTNVNLGGSDLKCKGALVGMLDASFNHVWSKCVPSAWGMSVDALPTIGALLAGDYGPGTDFGQGALPDSGVFLASFGATGSCDASVGGPSTLNTWQELYAVSFLTWPDGVIAGACHGTLNFSWGTVSCPSNSYPGAFVARLAP